ncbi:MAG: rane protein [Francisellaceae bacterium]|nr:rane protein [Francisellaceae bacterium]
MNYYKNYIYIASTIGLTVYCQIILKLQMNKMGALPENFPHKIKFLFNCLLNPIILSAFISAFLASITWMAAITKFKLNYAYPFMSLSFVIVIVLSHFILKETISYQQLFGVFLIIVGTCITAQG